MCVGQREGEGEGEGEREKRERQRDRETERERLYYESMSMAGSGDRRVVQIGLSDSPRFPARTSVEIFCFQTNST